MIATAAPEGLLIDEHIRADSQVVRTYLNTVGGQMRIVIHTAGSAASGGALPAAVVLQVMRRYGRPLDDEVAAGLTGAPRLEIAAGIVLVRMRWRAAVDADGRDWLVLMTPDGEPCAALATGVAAALRYLALL